MKSSPFLRAVVLFSLVTGTAVAQRGDNYGPGPGANNGTSATVTSVTGTITQLNYGDGGAIEGFLIGTNVLLTFPTNVSGGIGSLGVAGNSVTHSGSAVTSSSGFESVRVSSFTNNTTKATYTAATAGLPQRTVPRLEP
jgi:hypothetical protein